MEKYHIRNNKGELVATVTLNVLLKSQLFQSDAGEWVTKKYADGTSKNCFVMKKHMVFCYGETAIYLFTDYHIRRVPNGNS